MKNLTLLIGIGLLMTACQKEPMQTAEERITIRQQTTTNTDQIDSPVGPRLFQEMGQAPAQSGPKVFRIDGAYSNNLLWTDEKSGLTIFVGIDIEDFCSTFQFVLDVLPLQMVLGTSREDRQIIVQKGDIQVKIYDGIIEPNEFVCDFIATTPLAASGMAKMVLTDNDLLVWQTEDNKNHNAWSYTLHSILERPNGEEVRFNGMLSWVWDGTDEATYKFRHRILLI